MMLYQIDNKAVPIDEMVAAGKLLVALMKSNVLVPVEPDYEAAATVLADIDEESSVFPYDAAARKVVDAALKGDNR